MRISATAVTTEAFLTVAARLSLLAFRAFRGRAVVELENLALRHQLHVLRRQRPGRLRLFSFDRLLWVLLYRLWPRCLEVMVLVTKDSRSCFNGSLSIVSTTSRLERQTQN